jgi:NitT/TauT family transport system substrate-binding protein
VSWNLRLHRGRGRGSVLAYNRKVHRRTFVQTAFAAFPLLPALTSCSNKASKIRLALNWKPDPQFGGFYAADYQKHGLDVDILPGGAGTPTVQMVGAGSAEFGIVSADEIVLARARGNDVVGIFAVYQNCPQGIMVHASRGLKSIGDVVKDGTLAIQRGLPYARMMEKKFGFQNVKVVPSPGGDISAFLTDKKFSQQCFIVSEPLTAKRRGADVQVFPVADLGYNPYTTVLAVSGETLKKNQAMAKTMVEAVREGWRAYLDNAKPTNDKMHALNPSMAEDVFAEIAEAQKPYIETDETKKNGLGMMSKESWAALIGDLVELGDIAKPVPPEDCFRAM